MTSGVPISRRRDVQARVLAGWGHPLLCRKSEREHLQ